MSVISAKRPSKPWLVVGPVNRQPSSGRGGCGNGWEGLLVPSYRLAYRPAEMMLEQPRAKPKCGIRDSRPGGLLDSRPVSHLAQSPADHAGGERPVLAVGPGVAPQMHREETEGPGGLLGTVEGAR